MKTLVVEDSRLARDGLLRMLSHYPQLQLIGGSADADRARKVIQEQRPDLLFLDIHMPGDSGFELLASLSYEPKVIFTTAYSDYAIQSFEHRTVDYLLKPITRERLHRAVEKLNTEIEDVPSSQVRLDMSSRVFIKDGERCYLLPIASIDYMESCKNHARVFFDGDKAFVKKSLSQLELRLPLSTFIRANRQYIINVTRIESIEEAIHDGLIVTMQDGTVVEVSRRATNRLREQLSL